MISPLVLSVLLAVQAADAPAAAPERGDLWELTTQMVMEGMPMALPSQKMKVCTPKVWTEPPAGSDERRKCTASDFQMQGTKATWKITCLSPRMTGEGEVTRNGDDAYNGAIKFTSDDGAMTMKIDGKRLAECDVPR